MFYYSGKKRIPDNLSLLTPLAIAIWFMDDGTKQFSYKIATDSFEKVDIQRLQEFLKMEWNIETTIQWDNGLYIRSKSKEEFKKLIEPYVIESMKYKL